MGALAKKNCPALDLLCHGTRSLLTHKVLKRVPSVTTLLFRAAQLLEAQLAAQARGAFVMIHAQSDGITLPLLLVVPRPAVLNRATAE